MRAGFPTRVEGGEANRERFAGAAVGLVSAADSFGANLSSFAASRAAQAARLEGFSEGSEGYGGIGSGFRAKLEAVAAERAAAAAKPAGAGLAGGGCARRKGCFRGGRRDARSGYAFMPVTTEFRGAEFREFPRWLQPRVDCSHGPVARARTARRAVATRVGLIRKRPDFRRRFSQIFRSSRHGRNGSLR